MSAPIAMSLPPPSFASATPVGPGSGNRIARSAGRVARKIAAPSTTRLPPICSAICRAFGSMALRRNIAPSLPSCRKLHHGGVAEGDTILRLARRFEGTLVGETVTGETWVPEPPKGARFDRHVRFTGADGKVKVEAVTTWALLDRATGRLLRVPQELADRFVEQAG